MSIAQRIRKWLSLDEQLQWLVDLSHEIDALSPEIRALHITIDRYRGAVEINNRLLARIVAKLDPMYAIPEDDPIRRAASDRLTEEIIARIRGEFLQQELYKNV